MASPHAGLLATSRALRSLHLPALAAANLDLKTRARGLTEGQFVEAILLLPIAGGECPEDLELFRHDACLARGLRFALSKPRTARDFLALFHEPELELTRPARADQKSFILLPSRGVSALQTVQVGLVHNVAKAQEEAGAALTLATIDQDATLIESHKEAAQPHCEGGR